MSAITLGFREFEGRLERIRRRLNAFALQDAFCVVGAAFLLASTALLVSAFAASSIVFTWVFRTTASVLVLTTLAAAYWLHQRWLNLRDTALFVDRKAKLDARITTMLAHPAQESTSSLRSVLLGQVYETTARWSIDKMAPRQVRRPAYALAASLIVFVTTFFFLPKEWLEPPREVATANVRNSPRSELEDGVSTGSTISAASIARSGETNHSTSAQQVVGSHPMKIDPDDASERESSNSGNRQVSTENNRSGKGEVPREDDDLAATNSGGEESRHHSPNDDEDDGAGRDSEKQNPNGSDRATQQQNKSSKKDGKRSTNRDKDTPDPNEHAQPPISPENQRQDRSSGGGASGKEVGKGGQPLGKKANPHLKGAHNGAAPETTPMLIKLKAFAMKPKMEFAPQGDDPNPTSGDGAEIHSHTSEIAKNQVEDTLFLSRPEISRRHRDFIRQLFTPSVHHAARE